MVGSSYIGQGEYYDISSIKMHEDFNNPKKYANDIALVWSNRAFDFSNPNIGQIDCSRKYVPEKQAQLEVTGWGRKSVSFFIKAQK